MIYAVAAGIIFLASFLFAMLGLGGGMVYVPVLHWIGFDLKTEAIPLGLLLNGLNTLLALVVYGRKGLVDWRGGWPMGLAATLSAPLGALMQPHVPRETLLVFFAAAVAAAALKILLSGAREPKGRSAHVASAAAGRVVWSVLAGLLIGFIGGMLGIGGGFIVAPVLMAMGYPTKRAAATTALVVTFSSFSGFAGYAAQGHFPVGATAMGLVAVLLGSQLGARFMTEKAKGPWIKRTYGIVLVVIAAKLALEAL